MERALAQTQEIHQIMQTILEFNEASVSKFWQTSKANGFWCNRHIRKNQLRDIRSQLERVRGKIRLFESQDRAVVDAGTGADSLPSTSDGATGSGAEGPEDPPAEAAKVRGELATTQGALAAAQAELEDLRQRHKSTKKAYQRQKTAAEQVRWTWSLDSADECSQGVAGQERSGRGARADAGSEGAESDVGGIARGRRGRALRGACCMSDRSGVAHLHEPTQIGVA